eukprot:365806-Chlamydomonas_euryale.AAC.16
MPFRACATIQGCWRVMEPQRKLKSATQPGHAAANDWSLSSPRKLQNTHLHSSLHLPILNRHDLPSCTPHLHFAYHRDRNGAQQLDCKDMHKVVQRCEHAAHQQHGDVGGCMAALVVTQGLQRVRAGMQQA